MAFVEVGVGTAMLYGAAIGAGTGALYAGATGGNILNGALMGGGIGALGGAGAAGIAGASWGGAAAEAVATADATAVGMGFSSAAEAIAANPANAALLGLPEGTTAAQAAALGGSSSASAGFVGSSPNALQAAGAANTVSKLGAAPVQAAGNVPSAPGQDVMPVGVSPSAQNAFANDKFGILPGEGGNIGTLNGQTVYPETGLTTPTIQSTPTAAELKALQVGGPQGPTAGGGITGMFSGIGNFVKEHPYLTAAGVGGAAYLLGSQGKSLTQPNYLPTYTPTSAASMGLNRTLSSSYKPIRMAQGGIADLADGGSLKSDPINVNFMKGDMYPMSQQDRSYYATPSQMPTSAQQTMASYEPKTNPLTGELTANMADGGIAGGKYNLGSYSDGGRLLKGPGDGMSDNIPATIADKQPARLADGEFVVSADVVSGLGNGSTDAGAKHLYKMMDNVRKARTGRKSQGKQIKADKYLPK